MKIFSYIGSRNADSRTFKYTEKILQDVSSESPKTEIEIQSPLTMPLMHSVNCKTCFNEGYCPLEKKFESEDFAKEVKDKLNSADIIFISSPVHSHNVSSDIKILVDRLSYWLHIFKLAGKKIFLLITAESNGANFVESYLFKVFNMMGGDVRHTVSFLNSDRDIAPELMSETSTKILETINNNYDIRFDETQEIYFKKLKLIMRSSESNVFEYNYWKEKRMLEYSTLQKWYDNERENQ